MMASVGMGWSVLPDTMIDEDLYVLPVKDPVIKRQLGAVSYNKKRLGKAALAFIDTANSIWDKSTR